MSVDLGDICLYILSFTDEQVIIADYEDDLQYTTRKLREEYIKWLLD